MKIKSILKELVVMAFVIFAFACSSDNENDDGGTGTGGSGGGSAIVTAITVESNVTSAFAGIPVTFGVVNNLGADVTAGSVFTVNGVVVENPYVFPASGSYTVTATNGDFTDTITIEIGDAPTAITLTVDNNLFWYDKEDATFTVIDDLGNNITEYVVYSTEAGTVTNPTNFTSAGDYNAVATFVMPNSTLTSNSVNIVAVESTHTTKVLVEDYTGTWCGYCPRLATALENTVTQNSNVIPVAIHDDNEMLFPYANQMESTFGVNGFPTGKVNRTITWNESSSQPIGYLSTRQNMGLAINSSIAGNTITAEVKVHYDLKVNSENKIVVYLLENGLVYDQVNYYNGDPSSPWYQAGNPIVGFVHDHTARSVFTNIFGDVIPVASTDTNSTFTGNYTLTVPASVQNTDNLELVAFVVGLNNKVLNVQKADLGENKDFD
ncbi:Omp28-related outer membrane protein [Lacinutrix algicola]|uniref:Omp28-related outer membrane protein n=1 Tax=Lacinutrix algicola TaxID=342954 RepID=UPI0006E16AB1|nr:Omp28-related outer membrane protein [Lacinutrix algicola]